jgi:hypothetical protein
VTQWRKKVGLTVEKSEAHVRRLQKLFVGRLGEKARGALNAENLVSDDLSRVGHFLTFRIPGAPALSQRLSTQSGVLADARGDRLRFGFGLYHDEADVDGLFGRLDRDGWA